MSGQCRRLQFKECEAIMPMNKAIQLTGLVLHLKLKLDRVVFGRVYRRKREPDLRYLLFIQKG